MNNDTAARILRAFAHRWLDKTELDTKRNLRKLVEFGCYFSASPQLRKFFRESRNILNDNKSKYYLLAHDLTKSVDKSRTAEFGITFGYYGLAKEIEKASSHNSAKDGENHFVGVITGNEGQGVSNADELKERIFKLAQSGVTVFFIFCGKSSIKSTELKSIIDAYPQKAFFIFTDSDDIAMSISQKNIMPVLDLKSGSYDLISNKLRSQERLYGGYYRYNDETSDEIITKAFLNNVYEKNCLFLFLIEDIGCSQSSHDKVNNFSYHQKRKPSYPVFVTELFGDLKWLNESVGTEKNPDAR
ncbi:MAG: hypothetical protein GXY01_01470 [Clostridiales bacterium]|nr:hypothetical protein [Clostridiales bacterium]